MLAQACGLNSVVVYFYFKTHDVWKGNVTKRNDILN